MVVRPAKRMGRPNFLSVLFNIALLVASGFDEVYSK
jgi:hypothetical protein